MDCDCWWNLLFVVNKKNYIYLLKVEGLQILLLIIQCISRNLEYHHPRIVGG